MSKNANQAGKTGGEKRKADTTHKHHSGGVPSEKQERSTDHDANRNTAEPEKKIPSFRTDKRNFDLVIDGVPYFVKCEPFLFNEELRFHISINDDAEHIFTWDSESRMIRAIDDDSSIIPAGVENAISEKLQSR